ncbi:hypothetical protein BKA82DRAFT_4020414 [Pisolithus tinctorius]|nr:hypothetical protein BKA82DRAFT_4020414 [Pisolithus tinctorius]
MTLEASACQNRPGIHKLETHSIIPLEGDYPGSNEAIIAKLPVGAQAVSRESSKYDADSLTTSMNAGAGSTSMNLGQMGPDLQSGIPSTEDIPRKVEDSTNKPLVKHDQSPTLSEEPDKRCSRTELLPQNLNKPWSKNQVAILQNHLSLESPWKSKLAPEHPKPSFRTSYSLSLENWDAKSIYGKASVSTRGDEGGGGETTSVEGQHTVSKAAEQLCATQQSYSQLKCWPWKCHQCKSLVYNISTQGVT